MASESKALKVFVCQGEKIKPGATTYFAYKQCGNPAFKEDISVIEEGCEKIEKWHYDCFGRGYIDEFIFKAGILIKRSRGKKSQGTQTCK